MGEFLMPSLGADMTEGTLVEWLVRPGDEVRHGDVVAVVDTVKSAIEVEVFESGRVDELLVEPGACVPVGTALAVIAASGEPTPAKAPAKTKPSKPRVSPVVRHLAHELGVDLAEVSGTGAEGAITRADLTRTPGPQHVSASPLARRRAADLGVDLTGVNGSGPNGAITVADVEAAGGKAAGGKAAGGKAAGATPVPAPVGGPVVSPAPASMRTAIGALMARSKREIPHYYLQTTVDVSAAMTWLEQLNADRPATRRVLPAALLLKAAATAVRSVPDVNGFFVDGAFQRSDHVHLGVAVSLRGGGLVAPAIHDADQLTVEDLMAALKDLVTRARAGRLRGSEMADPTITVTNLGDQGAELVHGVIYPPQVALVGLGRIVDRPWAVDRMLTVRPVVTATLAADHRVTDGHLGGLYLAAVAAALQNPEEL